MIRIFYLLKPVIPRFWQIFLRRILVRRKRIAHRDVWPIMELAGTAPVGWNGWPEGNKFALVLTHDVESRKGHDRCLQLMKLEKDLGFRSSFYFVPERYPVLAGVRDTLQNNGFEVGLHGLNHDGRLYYSKEEFTRRAGKINHYINAWNAVGFRSPAMHHKLEWIHQLNIEYDTSTFDTDPFEPQPDGVGTIFPFWVANHKKNSGYVELPYTLVQDFTLFIVIREKGIDIWKNKLDWIVQKGGMALLNVHPDYLAFPGSQTGPEEFPLAFYREFLEYVKEKYHGSYWHALPREVARFWRITMNASVPPGRKTG